MGSIVELIFAALIVYVLFIFVKFVLLFFYEIICDVLDWLADYSDRRNDRRDS